MADAKITALSALTAPLITDVLPIVSDPAGTPLTQKVTLSNVLKLVYPVGSIYISTASTNPNTLFGFGTWAAFGVGKTLVSLDTNDSDFNTSEGTGGAKTVAASVQDHASHTHSVTSNVAVADHASHTHSVTSNVTATVNEPSFTITGTKFTTSGSGTAAATAFNGTTIASGATSVANPAQTVTVTNNAVTSAGPSITLSHTVTNNAVTSAGPSATLTHTGTATSVVQPYIVVYMFKRTA